MRAAIRGLPITKIAIFEPPLSISGSIRLELIDRFRRESATGDLAGAMVTEMRVAQMGPALFRRLPRPVLRTMTSQMIKRDDRCELPPQTPHLRQLVAALAVDLEIVAENADRWADFTTSKCRPCSSPVRSHRDIYRQRFQPWLASSPAPNWSS